MNRQNATKSRTNKTKNNKHPRRAGRDVARRPSSRPSPDADHPVPRSIVFLSIGTSSPVPPVPSSSSSSRARAFKVTPPTRTSKEETTRSRARRTVDGLERARRVSFCEHAFGLGDTIDRSQFDKMGLDFRVQSAITRDRSIAIRSVCVRIHSMDRSIDGISTLIECGRDLIDGNARSRELIGGFCGSGLDSDRWFDGVANRSRRLTHDE